MLCASHGTVGTNGKRNRQICKLLNRDTPRPGEIYRLPVGVNPTDEITIEATMPGALDFDKGIVKVDFQLWPFFQAVDVDHILTSTEVGFSLQPTPESEDPKREFASMWWMS